MCHYHSFKMECPRRWTFVAIIVYLSFQDTALCYNMKDMARENRECTKLSGNPSSSDLLNSVLNTAANNGVLPDLIKMQQGQPIVEKLSKCPYPPEMLAKPVSVIPIPLGTNPSEPIVLSTQPVRPPTLNQNLLLGSSVPCESGCPSNMILPQTIIPSSPSNSISQIAQALPLENYPTCAPNTGVVRPTPIVLQPQSKCNEINSYSIYNQIVEPIPLPDVSTQPLNVPILSTTQTLSPINTCSGTLEIIPNTDSTCLPQALVFTNDGQPFQINVPPNIAAPAVTLVSANPSNSPLSAPFPCYPGYATNSPLFEYPPQPIVLEKSKSTWQKLLPIILMALLTDRGCDDGGRCCGCCCSCDGGSRNNIPIPYPIPIPTNNPVINTYPPCSRNRDRDDENDDHWKRK